jgi:hypothetical protein
MQMSPSEQKDNTVVLILIITAFGKYEKAFISIITTQQLETNRRS